MQTNKMGTQSVGKLILSMGLPMILSMILQALYNVVDTVFVVNMGADGTLGNLALSAAFPVQIMMIAVGVGSGVGINAVLSKSLGKGDKLSANKIAGNGLFSACVFYAVTLFFGLFLAKPYMRLMTDNRVVEEMGTQYLQICCCLSMGSIGFAVAERFLIATGKTLFSMISQIAGAVTNIVLDYVFIYPMGQGIAGAAYATVIGQIVSLVLALIFHYSLNKEIDGSPKYFKPDKSVLKNIYKIGFPAFLMQAMLSLMMFGVLLIVGTIDNEYTVNLLTGGFGIYYKLMQTALFAAFGLSNTLISVVSYNYGKKDFARVKSAIRYGILYSVIVAAIITLLYQAAARPISALFSLTVEQSSVVAKSDIVNVCVLALRIASTGYVFMGFIVAVQGVLQGFNEVFSPLILSALRLIVLVLPLCYLFTLNENVSTLFWLTFPITEIVTSIVAFFFLKRSIKKRLTAESPAALTS